MEFDREMFERRMAELRRDYRQHLPGRRAEIETLAAAIAKNPATGEAREKISEILEIVHKLSGSAGSFGAPEVGDIAADVERVCEAILKSADPPADGAWRKVERLLGGLTTAIDDVVHKSGGG